MGGQLTGAMLNMLCSNIPHHFLYEALLVDPSPNSVLRSHSVLRRERSG